MTVLPSFAKPQHNLVYPKSLLEVSEVVNKIQPVFMEESCATLSVYAGLVFGIPEDNIKAINVGVTSYVEGIQIRLKDKRALTILYPASADDVNDAIAPSSVTYESNQYVAFVEILGESGENMFNGDIPNIIDSSLYSGDSLANIIAFSHKFFGE